jgi:hypothetical protein
VQEECSQPNLQSLTSVCVVGAGDGNGPTLLVGASVDGCSCSDGAGDTLVAGEGLFEEAGGCSWSPPSPGPSALLPPGVGAAVGAADDEDDEKEGVGASVAPSSPPSPPAIADSVGDCVGPSPPPAAPPLDTEGLAVGAALASVLVVSLPPLLDGAAVGWCPSEAGNEDAVGPGVGTPAPSPGTRAGVAA